MVAATKSARKVRTPHPKKAAPAAPAPVPTVSPVPPAAPAAAYTPPEALAAMIPTEMTVVDRATQMAQEAIDATWARAHYAAWAFVVSVPTLLTMLYFANAINVAAVWFSWGIFFLVGLLFVKLLRGLFYGVARLPIVVRLVASVSLVWLLFYIQGPPKELLLTACVSLLMVNLLCLGVRGGTVRE